MQPTGRLPYSGSTHSAESPEKHPILTRLVPVLGFGQCITPDILSAAPLRLRRLTVEPVVGGLRQGRTGDDPWTVGRGRRPARACP